MAERAGYTVSMFLVDVSRSMGRTRSIDLPDGPNGEKRTREVTNLEWAVQFVLYKIEEMIFNGRKTEQCGVILFGSEETDNALNTEGKGYENVQEFIPIAQPNGATLTKLQSLRPTDEIGDPLDAVIVGVDTQDRYLRKKPTWTRKLYLITDGDSPIEVDDWEVTVKKMNSLHIHSTIIGVDFDDEEFGYQEEDKPHIKRKNEEFFHDFAKSLYNGVVGTCAFALQECTRPEVKVTKSALLGSILRLGDVDVRPEEAIEIMVKMSKCTAVVRPPTLKKFTMRSKPEDDTAAGAMDIDDVEGKEDTYTELKTRTEYFMDQETKSAKVRTEDEDEDIGGNELPARPEKRDKIDQEQLIRGFKYGSTYVPCPEGQFPRLSTRKGIDICGFFPDKNVRRHHSMGEVQYIWADPGSGLQQVAFSSLIRAMLDLNVVAIARWVSKDGMDPKVGLLIPREFERVDCFLWLQMPFADDIRKYSFPSLTDLISKKGERIMTHPSLPTKVQFDAMDEFVDAMDLMHAGDKDETGERQPWFDPRESYNPAVHRIKQAMFHAAIVTDLRENPLPPPHPDIVKFLEPPRKVLKRAATALVECKDAFNVKLVPKKVARARKDGHVRAEDDEGEELILDQQQKLPPSGYESQSGPSRKSQSNPLSSTLVGSQERPVTKKAADDEDSVTESESDEEPEPFAIETKEKLKKKHIPSPDSETEPELEPDLDLDLEDDPSPASNRVISHARPLADFRKNMKTGDIVTKAVEDLAWVIKNVVMKPFAARRHAEMIECMNALRDACLTEDEIDVWNAFLRDLKSSCLATKGIRNYEFWSMIVQEGRLMSLISDKEARKQGGQSDVKEEEAITFVKN